MLKGWNKQEWSWAFYDWANSAYALIVMTVFLPKFLKYNVELTSMNMSTTTLLGFANAGASMIVLFMAPVLGAIADQFGAKKRFLMIFASVGIVSAIALALVKAGNPYLAAAVFAVGNIGFSGANGFYDALMLQVTTKDKIERLSAFGFSLGYAGSVILFIASIMMVIHPEWLGLPDRIAAIRLSFVMTGVWWFIFMIPLANNVIEEDRLSESGVRMGQAIYRAFGEIKETYSEVKKKYRNAGIFLVAYWLYIDGVHTVIKMATVYSDALQFPDMVSITGVLIVQIIGIPSTLIFIWIAGRVGTKKMIFIGVAAYLVVTAGAPLMTKPGHFYILASVIGLAQGGIQAMSRSLFARLIPENEAGKYFGFYNMVGKFAAVIGPTLMAFAAIAFGERLSILAIPVLLIAGMVLLTRVDDPDQVKTA